ncbi:bifunctional serine/threonine protein kinase/MFS transporter [Streptomyces sp. NPDC048604]|uniref:bifunctional serine/threonine protein kinase/MFS transporter n=1 Tax=Streptomyces sp. NPDC048604 TaxID=3365578 RepID=UPI003716D80C
MDQLTGTDPTHIGAYRLIARLGAGGMGLVYLGRSEGGRTVAVKVVQAEHAGHPEFRRRFAREVAAARRVGGDWTAAVLDADPEAAVPWVATQYIPGPDLTSVVAEDYGPLPEHSVRTLANRLALALQAVHAAGLIHRDLKPSNVLVTVDGPRVIDFGIARAMDSLAGDSMHTRTGMLIGSAGFMSPEQVRGLELTPASDVFCLGAVLVYAATGRLLFGAADTGLNAHLFRVAEEEPDLTGVPEPLLPLVRECLQKDPALRPTPQQIAERTTADAAEEWLPGSVLAQLGRRAAQLLDYAPEPTPAAPADPRVGLVKAAAPAAAPVPPPPAYAPTTPAHHVPPQGFGPPQPYPYPYPQVPAGPDPKRWLGLRVAVWGQLAVLFAASASARSAAETQADLGLHSGDIGSLFGLYTLGTAAALLLGGHLADVVGARRTLTIGLSGLVVACVLGGLTPAYGPLAGGRLLQGVFAGLVVSAGLSLVTGGFTDPGERRRAYGVWAALLAGGWVVAALAGGALVEFAGWRPAEYAGVPFAVTALIGALRLPAGARGGPGGRFDTAGVLLGSAGMAALVFGLNLDGLGGSRSWTSPLTLVTVVGGLALLAAYLGRRTGTDGGPHPFGPAARAGGLLALLLAGVGVLAMFWTMNYYLSGVAGHPPTVAGLLQLPMAVGAVLGALALGPALTRRTGPQMPATAGLATAAAGVALLTGIDAGGGYAFALPSLLLVGLGTGLAFAPLLAVATAAATPLHAGAAAAAVLAAQQVGETAGGAVLSTVLNTIDRDDVQSEGSIGGAVLGAFAFVNWVGAGALLLAAVLAGATIRGGTRGTQEDAVR